MRPERLRSASFRLTLSTAALYMAVGWALLAFVHFNTRSIMENRVDLAIEAERARVLADLRGLDRAGIGEAVRVRIHHERGSARLYRFVIDGGEIVDNFVLADGRLPEGGERSDVSVRREPNDRPRRARLVGVTLPSGPLLVLGRDLTEEDEFGAVMRETVLVGGLLMVVLAFAAGSLTGHVVMRRLAGFAAAAGRVVHGHLDERMPIAGGGDEFDHLAAHLNEALDRIEDLMAATRHVTDDIAHDLRSPLSRVRGRLEYLQLSAPAAPETEAALADCVADLDQILETFEALLSIARLEHGVASRFEPGEPAEALSGLVDYFVPTAEEKGQTLRLTVADGPALVAADRNLLFQALSNIVDNALRHTPAGGAIEVSLRRDGGRTILRIADDGPGIREADRRRVLRRFVRLDESRHLPGTGLGLAVVDAVVRHHGAQLALEDADPGLAVVVTFPPPPEKPTEIGT
ncbi:MAG: HAMP domain-containing histidine kinase [Siculibacillus sp.]|nr:HAMP domain-containing histidine kinase [Siculibacillus sp.]